MEYALVSLVGVSLMSNVYMAMFIVTHLRNENGKLQAAAFARRADPITAAVYQTYDPNDERAPEQVLEDTPQNMNRDTKPLGL